MHVQCAESLVHVLALLRAGLYYGSTSANSLFSYALVRSFPLLWVHRDRGTTWPLDTTASLCQPERSSRPFFSVYSCRFKPRYGYVRVGGRGCPQVGCDQEAAGRGRGGRFLSRGGRE